jgi:hypothetical protein
MSAGYSAFKVKLRHAPQVLTTLEFLQHHILRRVTRSWACGRHSHGLHNLCK